MYLDPNDPFGQVSGLRRLLLYARAFAIALWRTARERVKKRLLILRLSARLAKKRLGGFFRPLRRFLKPALAVAALTLAVWGAYEAGMNTQLASAFSPAEAEAAGPDVRQEPESQQEPEGDVLTLYYDDRWVVPAGTEVRSLGANVPDGGADPAILTLEDGVLTAVGTGETVLALNTGALTVRVEPAPISLLLLIGQSNMEGNEGDPAKSVASPAGQVYSTYGPSSEKLAGVVGGNSEIPLLSGSNADGLVASALTGEGSAVSRTGSALAYPLDALTAGGGGKGGLDSGIAYAWQESRKEKVWVVNAAHSGSAIETWLPGKENFREAVALFTAAQDTLGEEVAAGHYAVSRMGYFWLQGCSDRLMSAEEYKRSFLAMHTGLKNALRCELGEVSFAAVLMVQAANGDDNFTTWRELDMNGPRRAQYEMGASFSEDFCDVFVVSTVMENWVYDDGGENSGVREYFEQKYGATITYPVQDGTRSWPIPLTPRAVKDSIHYNQVGYNEIGLDAAENMARVLSMMG